MNKTQINRLLVNFGQNVLRYRLARDMTQKGLAVRAGLHRSYIADIERGERNPSIVSMARISKALKISISVLSKGA
jgi:transcriptional regulator with XRE-family HTH domain